MPFVYAECKSNEQALKSIFYRKNKPRLVSFFVHRRKSIDRFRINVYLYIYILYVRLLVISL